jgi:hypothetical protein
MEENDGVVDVVVATHCVNAAPRLAYRDITGIGMVPPNSVSTRRESITSMNMLGLVKLPPAFDGG